MCVGVTLWYGCGGVVLQWLGVRRMLRDERLQLLGVRCMLRDEGLQWLGVRRMLRPPQNHLLVPFL